MNKSSYKHVSPLAPGKFVGNLVGGLTGAASGFLKSRQEAKESGEKMTFKGAIGDVLLGAGKGALDPTGLSGIKSLATQGLSTIKDDAQRNEIEREANELISKQWEEFLIQNNKLMGKCLLKNKN